MPPNRGGPERCLDRGTMRNDHKSLGIERLPSLLLLLGGTLVPLAAACGNGSEDETNATSGKGGDAGAALSGAAGTSGGGGATAGAGAGGQGGSAPGGNAGKGGTAGSGGSMSGAGGNTSGGMSSGGAQSGAGNSTGGVTSAGASAGGGAGMGGSAGGVGGGGASAGSGGVSAGSGGVSAGSGGAVNTKQCGPLPFSTCPVDEVCLRLETRMGDSTQLTWECGANPCDEAPIECACAASLCETWMAGAGCAEPLVPSEEDLTCRLEL
jgi:hypothetical protein